MIRLDSYDNIFGKMKVLLKIKIFMWFLHRKFLLEKDNLAKRNWYGCKACCFRHKDESIQHLFFDFPFAKVTWHIVYMMSILSPPANDTNLSGYWLANIPKKDVIPIRLRFA
jgi:hypothetical protein